MLYTIGYQHLTDPDDLVSILLGKRINYLIDVRSRPYGRKYLFNKKRLEGHLPASGINYSWQGDKLGGFAKIHEVDIKTLAIWQKDKTACLMCMEADPNQCHRKYEIAKRLKKYGISVEHILT
jgi:uncharacterized protein (DUF488 family)